jgi:RNA polymerase sigma factor (sigma-70 family)
MYYDIMCGGPGDKNVITYELFTMYQPYIQHKAEQASKETGIDSAEFESCLSVKVWTALEKRNKDGGATFYTYLRRIQNTEIAKVIRDEKSKNSNEVHTEKLMKTKSDYVNSDGFQQIDNTNDVGLIEMSCNIDNEDLDRELIRKDQRQLVSDLVRGSGKNAPKVEPIVSVFLNGDVTSLQDVGDVLGESKQTVSNRLKSLRKVFGEHDFGSISDYYVA